MRTFSQIARDIKAHGLDNFDAVVYVDVLCTLDTTDPGVRCYGSMTAGEVSIKLLRSILTHRDEDMLRLKEELRNLVWGGGDEDDE